LSYTLEAMRDAGFDRVSVTVNGAEAQYHRLLGNGSELGVHLTYSPEAEPLGTAGCLRRNRPGDPKSPILVVNGNLVLSSDDLHHLLEAHRESRAAVTVGVIPSEVTSNGRPQHDRLSIGPEGSLLDMRVDYPGHNGTQEFRSAGIYLFERSTLARMPDRGYYDLKEQFIPRLLKSGLRVRTHPLRNYLQELNSLEDYLKIHFDLCHGRTGLTACGKKLMDGIQVQGPVDISPDAVLIGPMILGAGVRVSTGCRLVGPLVVGRDTEIGSGVFLREAVVGEGVRLDRGSRVERSILADNLEVPEGARIVESVATSQGMSQGDLNLIERDLRVGVTTLPFEQFVRTGLRRTLYCGFKRVFDLVFAGFALALSLPIMVAVALAIRWGSGRPVLFRQRRCGRNGEEFTMLKFRSMRVDADKIRANISHLNECDGPVFKINKDPRFTRVGELLRKYSLDELPQLWNVLRGDMSVVGPRPLAEDELRTCPSWRDARLRVKPGLTGLWQVSSREKKAFHEWIEHDLRYVREQSLTLDMMILLRTFAVLAKGL
jgi:lipopolysaccharide/colanic/teichoic acid biosynthesis glycosyltransferase